MTTFEKVTRQIVMDMKDDIREIKESIKSLVNHYSRRMPLTIVVLITTLSSLSVGLIIRSVYI